MLITILCAMPVKKYLGFFERIVAVSEIQEQEKIPVKICSAPNRALPECPGTPG